jgi:NAD(P)H dehydrogenase (quinone)
MTTISVVYHSGNGHTTKLAEAVAKGASAVAGVKVQTIALSGKDIIEGRYKNAAVFEQLDASDAIIFGSPTYMGGPSGQFKTFADATAGNWFGQKWKDKIASGFSVSSSPAGDKFSTLQYFHTLAMQHSMIWVGLGELPMQPNGVNRLGSFAGATAQAGQESPDVAPNEADKLTGEILGRRVAESAKRWKGQA